MGMNILVASVYSVMGRITGMEKYYCDAVVLRSELDSTPHPQSRSYQIRFPGYTSLQALSVTGLAFNPN